MAAAERAPDGKRILSVSGLLEAGRSVLETEIGPVWVEAEVFEYRGPHHGSGHSYFKLRDGQSSMSAILWRGVAARALTCRLEEGKRVLVRGRFDIYAARGTLSFVLDHVEDRGAGDLAQRFEELKRKLQEEGVFDSSRKAEIPALPTRLVLITGGGSAAEADVLHVFEQERHPIQVLVRQARVQGEGAVPDLLRALEEAVALVPDLILLSRGGGSLEDLWAFNEEALVRAVGACPIPVISAVGHEVDFTLCDFAADDRAITPTAGAQGIVSGWVEFMESLAYMGDRLARCGEQFLVGQRHRLDRGTAGLLAQQPKQRLERQRLRCRHAEQRLVSAAQGSASRARSVVQLKGRSLSAVGPGARIRLFSAALEKASARLEAGNPEGLLDRGYALVKAEGQERFLRDPSTAPAGTGLRIQVAKGALNARVE
ncbi:MAG: exodeoxyribonuclease VII large subunit [Planctomycetota bacterium]|jgi:exodeoxyribonuclease VII large subunit